MPIRENAAQFRYANSRATMPKPPNKRTLIPQRIVAFVGLTLLVVPWFVGADTAFGLFSFFTKRDSAAEAINAKTTLSGFVGWISVVRPNGRCRLLSDGTLCRRIPIPTAVDVLDSVDAGAHVAPDLGRWNAGRLGTLALRWLQLSAIRRIMSSCR